MFSRKLLVSFCAICAALTSPFQAFAMETPEFPLCVNPKGELKASYDSGVHGIPGDTNSHTGSDKVYSLNSDQLVQCFCAEDGTGIQTNWLKVGQLSDSERKSYENDGWIFVPNGALWGLENTSYVAKNISYSCKSGSTGGSNTTSNGTGGTSQGFSASFSGANGLASTGNIKMTIGFFVAGVATLVLGAALRRKSA